MASKDNESSVKNPSKDEEKGKLPDAPPASKRMTRSQRSKPTTSNVSPQSAEDTSTSEPTLTTAGDAITAKTSKQATGSQGKDDSNKKLSPTTEDHRATGEEVSEGFQEETSNPVAAEGAISNVAVDHDYPLTSSKDSRMKKTTSDNDTDSHEDDQSEEEEDGEEEEEAETQESTEAENIFECRFCSEFFILSSLKKHIEEKHIHVATEICPQCGYCEKQGGPIKDHPSCYACWTCSVFFRSKRYLREHMLLHDLPSDGIKDYWICKHCQARFSTRRGLELHRKMHDVGDKPKYANVSHEGDFDNDFPVKDCRLCHKFFKSDKSLHKHVKRVHTKVKTEICDRCGFFQEHGGALGKHLCETLKEKAKREKKMKRDVTPGGRYKCGQCSKTYRFLQGLRAHKFTHKPPSEKPFQCEVCNKAFAKKVLYEDHMRIHKGEKPYLCHVCAKCFRSGANLRQHQRRCKNKVHTAPPSSSSASNTMSNAVPPMSSGVQFMCQLCTQVFGSVSQLQEHRRTSLCYSAGASGDLVGEILEANGQQLEQPLVYEVQMEVGDGLQASETVVINLAPVDKRKDEADSKASSLMKEMIDMVETQSGRSGAPTESGDNKPELPVKAEPGDIVPVSIHKESEEEEAVKDIPSDIGAEKMGDAEGGDGDGDGPEPMEEENDDSDPPADHDYIKENHSVLEEQQQVKVKQEQKPKLLEAYFMCPKCKDLFDKKHFCKQHIKAKHKKAKKCEGTVVLGRSNANKRDGACEGTLPVDWAYQCSHCNAFFPEEKIQLHLEGVQMDLKEGLCKICFRNHKDGAKSNEYCKLSRARKVFQCPYCNVKPAVLCDLRSHLVMKHSDISYPCNLCEEKFTNKRGLSCHLNKHKRENEPKVKKKKTFVCEKCSRIMTDAQQFRIHLMQHDNPKPFACKLCDKAYNFPNGLRVHMRGHTKNFPFLCEYCSRTFKTKACLIAHIRCHTGDKPFNCSRCGKAFRTKANERQHMKKCNVPIGALSIEAARAGQERAELEIATEIVTEQPETYLLLAVQKAEPAMHTE